MYCHNCGNPIIDGAKFCQNCGTKVESAPEDLVAQQAETLDLSNDTEVNNDAQIEKSAKWSGNTTPTATPTKKVEPPKPQPVISTVFTSKSLDFVIRCEKYEGTSKYWFEDRDGNCVSDYYEDLHFDTTYSGKLVGCFVRKAGKYGLISYNDDGYVVQQTAFVFDEVRWLNATE